MKYNKIINNERDYLQSIKRICYKVSLITTYFTPFIILLISCIEPYLTLFENVIHTKLKDCSEIIIKKVSSFTKLFLSLSSRCDLRPNKFCHHNKQDNVIFFLRSTTWLRENKRVLTTNDYLKIFHFTKFISASTILIIL